MRDHRRNSSELAVIYQAASLCLSYPDETVLGRAALIRDAVSESAPEALAQFSPLLAWWESTQVWDVQRTYVELFDLTRRHTLYLTYWTDGDTRRRGLALADLKDRFRAAGLQLTTTTELPDFLPLVLEFAGHQPDVGAALIQDYRASLELIRLSLLEKSSPYAGVVAAVCDTLPGASPTDRQRAMAMAAAGPPAESVGLEPYDPRLLPLAGGRS
jgi:nitrate reductase molybdenum cofactor assembly chaperone NarJ/NarW